MAEMKRVPEIRFKGFASEWQDNNWADTVDISTNMVDPRNGKYDELFHIGPGNIESFTGRVYENVLKVKDSNLISGKFHFKKGDVIYGKINPQLAKYTIAPFEGLASADAYVLNTRNGLVQNYLYLILQSTSFFKYSVSVSSRTGMPKINRDELSVFNYFAPNEFEQAQIGSYFQHLDKLISLHQTKVNKPIALFAQRLESNLNKLNSIYAEIAELFAKAGVADFHKLPDDLSERGRFAKLFKAFNDFLEAAKIQGFVWNQLTYEFKESKTKVTLTLDENTYLILALRYKELYNGGGGV